PSASPGPTTVGVKGDQGLSVSPVLDPPVPEKPLVCRVFCGAPNRPARPLSLHQRPMVGANSAPSGAAAMLRVGTNRMIAPMIGAATNTVRSNATKVCTPQSTWICQNTYARNMPMAPWAKLKMPDVV